MTSKCFFTSAWTLGGDVEWSGPYPDKDTAQSILGENILGDNEMCGAVIGPLPFEQVITNGKWGNDEPTDLDKSIARQWAVFETHPSNVAWMAFGYNPEGFDGQRGTPGQFIWIGNYEGESPADIRRQLAENDERAPDDDHEYVCIPVGVFGPADWMRVAGDMLTKIKG